MQPTGDPTPRDTSPSPASGGTTDPGAPEGTTGPGETPAGSGGVVDLALQDLANRLGVGIDEITVARNDEVTWRDGSLGCAKKGNAYTMALVAGQLLVLEAGGETYEYHAAKSTPPFLCEDPQPPLPSAGG